MERPATPWAARDVHLQADIVCTPDAHSWRTWVIDIWGSILCELRVFRCHLDGAGKRYWHSKCVKLRSSFDNRSVVFSFDGQCLWICLVGEARFRNFTLWIMSLDVSVHFSMSCREKGSQTQLESFRKRIISRGHTFLKKTSKRRYNWYKRFGRRNREIKICFRSI